MAQAMKTPSPHAPPLRMSYEEFLEWADEDTHAEWVNGEVVFMSPISARHQRIGLFLLRIIAQYVEMLGLGAVFSAEFQMKLARSGREPDILFVANANRDRIKANHLEGPADLVIEIISPDDPNRDRVEKFNEYQEGGVPEYWLIDPEQKQADFYLRGEDGLFRSVPGGEDGIYRSTVVDGLWIRVDWLWQEPPPPLLSVLKEWRLL